MRVLLSAYACEAGRGSEPGVGWNWAVELAAMGHDVWVLTRANNRARNEEAWAKLACRDRLHFAYFDLSRRAAWWKRGQRGVQLYYFLWQRGAIAEARKLHAEHRFDAVQHVTFGVHRQPSYMGELGIPFLLGPIGGGERTPARLRSHLPLRGRLADALRDVASTLALRVPRVRRGFEAATLILAKTPDTLRDIPPPFRARAVVHMEIGISPAAIVQAGTPEREADRPLSALFVGRFLYWKGMGLGLRALGALRRRGLRVRLTMIGAGPEERSWRRVAASEGIEDQITWIPWLPQGELFGAYGSHDFLLFPSLHDSSGNAVLESLASGLPVVCLDVGGPAQIVDASCAAVIPTAERTEREVVDALADAIQHLAADPGRLPGMRDAARRRASQLTWSATVRRAWARFEAAMAMERATCPVAQSGHTGDEANPSHT